MESIMKKPSIFGRFVRFGLVGIALSVGLIAMMFFVPGSASAHGQLPEHEFYPGCWGVPLMPGGYIYALPNMAPYPQAGQVVTRDADILTGADATGYSYGNQITKMRLWVYLGLDAFGQPRYSKGNWVRATNGLTGNTWGNWEIETSPGSGVYVRPTIGELTYGSWFFGLTSEPRLSTSHAYVPNRGRYWIIGEFEWGPVAGYGTASLSGSHHWSEWTSVTC